MEWPGKTSDILLSEGQKPDSKKTSIFPLLQNKLFAKIDLICVILTKL